MAEFDYYAGLSGLSPVSSYSLADHQFAYFAAGSGLTPASSYSLSDHMRAFYKAQLVGEPEYFSLADLEYAYFDARSPLPTGSISDLQEAFFANPPVAPVITTTDLPAMTSAVPMSQQIAATGTAPITFAVTGGSVPGGLTVSSSGLVSGTPAAPGAYSFTVTATNVMGSDPQLYAGTIA